MRAIAISLRRTAAGALALGLAAATAVAQTPPPAALIPPPIASYRLEGFRAAQFGMTEAEVKQAIRKDFGLRPDKISSGENPGDRTTTLTITVDDLLQGGGPAQIVYVLGFSTKKLIQVSITWGGAVNRELKVDTAVNMANQLRNYFVAAGYKSDSMVLNTRMGDGSFVVFRGSDVNDRMTMLALTGDAADPDGAKRQPPVLQLHYVLDPRNPDIFRIQKGQF